MRDLIGVGPQGLSRGLAWTLLGVRVALAVFFTFAAARNLTGDLRIAADFARWGYPGWFRVLVAVLQVVGGLMLLYSATATWGAAILAGVLLGAVATHLRYDPPASALAPLPFLLAVLTVLVLYRPPLLR